MQQTIALCSPTPTCTLGACRSTILSRIIEWYSCFYDVYDYLANSADEYSCWSRPASVCLRGSHAHWNFSHYICHPHYHVLDLDQFKFFVIPDLSLKTHS